MISDIETIRLKASFHFVHLCVANYHLILIENKMIQWALLNEIPDIVINWLMGSNLP
jgi:hypothetical protein